MNSSRNNDAHERARKLIALAGPDVLSDADRLTQLPTQSSNAWLAAHLETCASCRAFAENAAEMVRGLRAIPIAAERSLVSTTQLKVRHRALELQRQSRTAVAGFNQLRGRDLVRTAQRSRIVARL